MNAFDLIDEFAARERALAGQRLVAPCIPGARLRVRLAGLLLTLRPDPGHCEGWGQWRVRGRSARWQGRATPAQVAEYQRLLCPCRLIPVRRLRGASWLAMPLSGTEGPRLLHLAWEPTPLEPVLARHDGAVYWFEGPDRRADPRLGVRLREALSAGIPAGELRIAGLTPAFHAAYALAWPASRQVSPMARLRRALATGGGRLADFQDRGEHWWVAWATADGTPRHSLIDKNLGVVAAGICLSGEDGHFDLASLVGVVEQAPDWA